MIRLNFFFALLLLALSFMNAQDRLDIIYLKNGDVLKGTIVENVPNSYVRIELPGGSLISIKYLEIAKLTRESPTPERTYQQSILPEKHSGELPQFREGVNSISGSIRFSKSSQEYRYSTYKQTYYSVSPGYSVFISDGLQLGGYVHYFYETSDNSTSSPNEKWSSEYKSYGASLSARYYIISNYPIPFFGANIGYEKATSSEVLAILTISFHGGVAFPISLNIGIEPTIEYTLSKGLGNYSFYKNTGFSAGINIVYYIFQ